MPPISFFWDLLEEVKHKRTCNSNLDLDLVYWKDQPRVWLIKENDNKTEKKGKAHCRPKLKLQVPGICSHEGAQWRKEVKPEVGLHLVADNMRTVSFVEHLEFEINGNVFSKAVALGDVDNDQVEYVNIFTAFRVSVLSQVHRGGDGIQAGGRDAGGGGVVGLAKIWQKCLAFGFGVLA